MAYDTWTLKNPPSGASIGGPSAALMNTVFISSTNSLLSVSNLTPITAGQKIYAEFTAEMEITAQSSQIAQIAIGNFFWQNNGQTSKSTFSSTATPTKPTGNFSQIYGTIICVAIDTINNKIFINMNGAPWNGSASVDPTVASTGYSLSAAPLHVTCTVPVNPSNSQWVCNFGQGGRTTSNVTYSGFKYAIPAGYGSLLQPPIPQNFYGQVVI